MAAAAAWEFHLPLVPSDLLRDSGPGRYVVQDILPARELPPALTGKARPYAPRTPLWARSRYRLTAATACVFPRPSPCFSAAFRAAFRAQGALAVLQHFDPIYSLLQ